jgi:endonuclease/exonuclease/phosphatase family metal-dependent hydrolase
MKLRIIVLLHLVIFLFISLSSYSQERVKIVTYNILNYPQESSTKNPKFQRIMSEINADIVVVQEILSQSAVNQFRDQVLGSDYSAGDFINGPDTDNAIFYRDSLFTFISTVFISPSQGPRYISVFKLFHNITLDTIIIYSAHFKASQGSDNELRRFNEAATLRVFTDMLPVGTDFILVGDLNLYRSTEPAYEELLIQDGTGYFLDPIDSPGSWHVNETFAPLHTQSTRTTDLGDGGSIGGLDDRFDFILSSQSILDEGGIDYVNNSYWAYGNDGIRCCNPDFPIHDPPNQSVSTPIAIDLYLASDHLPVIAEFDFGVVSDVEDEQNLLSDFVLYQNYPNPFNPSTKIKFTIPTSPLNPSPYQGEGNRERFVTLLVYDVLGNEIATLVNEEKPAGSYEVEFSRGLIHQTLTSGVYFYQLRAGGFIETKKMLLLK